MEEDLRQAEIWGIAWKPRKGPAKQQVPTFNDNPDTQARTAWRNKRAPETLFRLPKGFAVQEQRVTKRQNNDDALFRNFPYLRDVAQIEGVHMMIGHRRTVSSRDGLEIEIWGDAEHCQSAKIRIRHWIQDVTGTDPARRDLWPKLRSLSEEERKKRDKEFEQEVKVRGFCQLPPEDADFSCLATFQWPTNSTLGRPQKHLGQQLEALDTIRMQEQCWITCEPAQAVFTVMGARTLSVKTALTRLRAIYCQVAARYIGAQKLYVLAPPSRGTRTHVKLAPFKSVHGLAVPKVVPVAHGEPSIQEHPPSSKDVEKSKTKDHSRIKSAVLRSLAGLKYYRGNVGMRVCLGRLVLSQYWKGKDIISRAGFVSMMGETNVEGELSEDLSSLMSGREAELRDGSFPPSDILQHSVLRECDKVLPILSAMFLLKDREGFVQLRVEYSPDNNGHLDLIRKTWYRVGKDDGSLKEVLDAITVELDKELAWSLKIVASYPINEDREPALSRFAAEIRMAEQADQSVAQTPIKTLHRALRLSFKPEVSLQLCSIQQKEIFRYRFHHSDYVCEFAKVKDFKIINPDSAVNMKVIMNSNESAWTVSVHSDVWEKQLDQNRCLEAGMGVTWTPDVTSFFPRDVGLRSGQNMDGFAHFLDRIVQTELVIQRAREQTC